MLDFNLSVYILIPFALVNILAFLIMLSDKLKSTRTGAERIPEGVLFFLAALGGGLGVYAGMFILRHKTRKWYFLVGIPLVIAENAIAVYAIYAALSLPLFIQP